MTHKRLFGVAISALIVGAIGWIDYVTGPEIGMSLLYLVPIAVSAWFGGVAPAVFVGSLAGASWLAADLAWRTSDTAIAISIWNAFTRFVIYISEGVFIALLHRDRERLRQVAFREALLARTDSNTGLGNARAFLEKAEIELARARRERRSICVLYVDLDHFKAFNDRLGHAAGDLVLEEVARVMLGAVNPEDFVARIGGDEFAVLLCCDAEPADGRRIGETIARGIANIGTLYPDIGFGATIGVAYFREPPDNAEELLRCADDAMYRGKTQGKGQVVVQNV